MKFTRIFIISDVFLSIFSNRLFISFVRIQTYIRKLQDKNRKKNTNNKAQNVCK